jgi:hypothetical protein
MAETFLLLVLLVSLKTVLHVNSKMRYPEFPPKSK